MRKTIILAALLAVATRSVAQKEVFMKLPADQENFTLQQMRSLEYLDPRLSVPGYYEGIRRKLSIELPKIGLAETNSGYFEGMIGGKKRVLDVSTRQQTDYAWWHYFTLESVPFAGLVQSVAFDGKTPSIVTCDRKMYPGELFMTLDLSLVPGNEDLAGAGYEVPVASAHCGQWIRNPNPFTQNAPAHGGNACTTCNTYNTYNTYVNRDAVQQTAQPSGYDWWSKRLLRYRFAHWEKERSQYRRTAAGIDSLRYRDTVGSFFGSPLSFICLGAIVGGGKLGYDEYQEHHRRSESRAQPDPAQQPDTTTHINNIPTGPKPAPENGHKPGGPDVIDGTARAAQPAAPRYSYLTNIALSQRPKPAKQEVAKSQVYITAQFVFEGLFSNHFRLKAFSLGANALVTQIK